MSGLKCKKTTNKFLTFKVGVQVYQSTFDTGVTIFASSMALD